MNQEQNIELLWKVVKDPARKTMIDTLGIEFQYFGADAVRGTMPVDHRTIQYFGLLHGGASVAFAETLCSVAGNIHVDADKEMIVGLEINANHLRSATNGKVHGEAKPIHLGRKTQVWAIEIKNDEGKLVCLSRCTLAVVPRKDK
jgi:1,4-dihydroxy-2-naphthoyl-CoA hydrolase